MNFRDPSAVREYEQHRRDLLHRRFGDRLCPAGAFLQQGESLSFRETAEEGEEKKDVFSGYFCSACTAHLANDTLSLIRKTSCHMPGDYAHLALARAGKTELFSVLLHDSLRIARVSGSRKNGRITELREALREIREEDTRQEPDENYQKTRSFPGGVLDHFGLIALGLLSQQDQAPQEDEGDLFASLEEALSTDAKDGEEAKTLSLLPVVLTGAPVLQAVFYAKEENGDRQEVTDLPALLDRIRKREVTLTADSENTYRFLSAYVCAAGEEKPYEGAFSNREADGSVKASPFLYGRTLDLFYEVMKGQQVVCVDDKKHRGSLYLGPHEVICRLVTRSLRDENGVFSGVRLLGARPAITRGSLFVYACSGDFLTPLTARQWKIFRLFDPILKKGSTTRIEADIAPGSLRHFYKDVMPLLNRSRFIEIDDGAKSQVARYLAHGD